MAQPALSNRFLEDLGKLPEGVRQQVEDMIHAIAEGERPDQLRFRVDHSPTHGAGLRAVAPDAAPDVFLAEIRSLLAEGQVLMARRLAAAAAKRHPGHDKVAQADRVLNAGGSRIVAGDPEPSTDEEFAWLRHPPAWARGKWVALIGREAVAAADSLAELVDKIRSLDLPRKPLVHRIA